MRLRYSPAVACSIAAKRAFNVGVQLVAPFWQVVVDGGSEFNACHAANLKERFSIIELWQRHVF